MLTLTVGRQFSAPVCLDVSHGGHFEQLVSRRRQDLFGAPNIRCIDHHSLEFNRASPVRFRITKRVDELLAAFDLGIRGRKDLIDRAHLTGMYRNLAIEAVPAGKLTLTLERRL